jgi:hypothetical protein
MSLIKSPIITLKDSEANNQDFSIMMLVKTLGALVGAPLMTVLWVQAIKIGGVGLGLPYFVSAVSSTGSRDALVRPLTSFFSAYMALLPLLLRGYSSRRSVILSTVAGLRIRIVKFVILLRRWDFNVRRAVPESPRGLCAGLSTALQYPD